jgi:hypothetical protein
MLNKPTIPFGSKRTLKDAWFRRTVPLTLGLAFVAFTVTAGAKQPARSRTLQATIKPDGSYQLIFLSTGWTLN